MLTQFQYEAFLPQYKIIWRVRGTSSAQKWTKHVKCLTTLLSVGLNVDKPMPYIRTER